MVSLDHSRSSRKRSLWIGLAVLLVVALAVGAFFLARGLSGPSGSSSSSEDRPDGTASEGKALTAPPEPVHWTRYRDFAVPASSVHGPRSVSGGLAKGYSHTPEGALIAAAQLLYRMPLASTSEMRQIAEHRLTGPGKDALLAKLSGIDRSSSHNPSLQPVAGFRFVSYTGDRAVVEIVAGVAGSYRVATQTMAWKNRDWRLYIPHNMGRSHSLTDLSGYVSWSADDA